MMALNDMGTGKQRRLYIFFLLWNSEKTLIYWLCEGESGLVAENRGVFRLVQTKKVKDEIRALFPAPAFGLSFISPHLLSLPTTQAHLFCLPSKLGKGQCSDGTPSRKAFLTRVPCWARDPISVLQTLHWPNHVWFSVCAPPLFWLGTPCKKRLSSVCAQHFSQLLACNRHLNGSCYSL